MEAKDFRIGNFLQHQEFKGYGEIEGIEIFNDRFEIKVKGYVHTYGSGFRFDLEPILVNEEWLERFGFTQDPDNHDIWNLSDKNLSYDLKDYSVKISDTWEFGKRLYVHEIQNLYYELYKKDLELCC